MMTCTHALVSKRPARRAKKCQSLVASATHKIARLMLFRCQNLSKSVSLKLPTMNQNGAHLLKCATRRLNIRVGASVIRRRWPRSRHDVALNLEWCATVTALPVGSLAGIVGATSETVLAVAGKVYCVSATQVDTSGQEEGRAPVRAWF